MKRIIAAAAVLALAITTSAEAGVLAYIGNNAGGTIRFTDANCHIKVEEAKNWSYAYATNSKGSVVEGCWIWDNDTKEMITVYEDGSVRRYPVGDASFTDYFHKKVEQDKKKGVNI